jgi:hypothetical protein
LYAHYEPTTYRHAGRGLRGLRLDIEIPCPDTDKNGFTIGQKLQAHPMQVMHNYNATIFPLCVGIARHHCDKKMYPQYGNLNRTTFGTSSRPAANALQQRREELKMKLEKKGIELVIKDPPSAKKDGKGKERGIQEGTLHAGRNITLAERMEEELRSIEERRREDRLRRRRERRETRESER